MDIKDKIRNIIKKLKKNNYSTYCWYTKNGKLISCDSKKQFYKFLKKNKDEYKDKIIVEVEIMFNVKGSDKNDKLKKRDDIIIITASVKQVKISKAGIALNIINDTNSILEVKYSHKEVDNFDASEIKYIAKIAYSGKYPIAFHKDDYITYTKIKKDIKINHWKQQ